MKIGNLEFQNCYVEVIEQATPHSFYDGLQGTIGAGTFGRYLVDIDYPDAKLKLRPLPPRPATEDPDSATLNSSDPDAKEFHNRYVPPGMDTWERAFSFAPDGLFFPVRVNSSSPRLFYFDLGGGTYIAPELARESTSLTSKGIAPTYGADGIIKATFQTGPVRLEFADFCYDMVAYSIDLTIRSEEIGTEVSGLLGFDVLHNLDVKIDYRDGLIHFDNGREHH